MGQMFMSNSWRTPNVPHVETQQLKGAPNVKKNGIVQENVSSSDGKITRRSVPW